MKYKTFVFALMLATGIHAQNRSINFEHGTFTEVKAKAAKENKLIFIDCYTTWCGPCKWMAKNVFTNDTVADYFNQNFICAKFDMEAGEGIDMAKKYEIMAYPNLIFLDGKGELVHRAAGGIPAADFIALAKNAQNPDKSYRGMLAKFTGGNNDPVFVNSFLKATSESALDANEYAVRYLSAQKESDLSTRPNWTLINLYLNDINSSIFKYLVAHTADFTKRYTEDSVFSKIESCYLQSCMNSIYNPAAKKKYSELKVEIKKTGLKNADKIIGQADMAWYQKQGDNVNYAKTAVAYMDKYPSEDPNVLNNMSWTFYEKVTDPKMLAKAVEWSKKSNELHKDHPAFLDTYASLLFKSGNKKEAIAQQEKAISIVKKSPDAYGGESLLKELESRLAEFKK